MRTVASAGRRPRFRRSARAPGTWAKRPRAAKQEAAALRLGIELGMTLIDTAEMYGSGRAEELVAEAIAGQPRRVVHRQQGVSAQRLAHRHAGGVRAQPEAAAHRPDRSVSAALARQPSAGGDGGGVRGAEGGGENPLLGRVELRHLATWRNWRGCRTAAPAPPTRCCTIPDSRGIEFDLLPWCARASHAGDGLFAGRAQGGRLLRSAALAGGGEAARRDAGADRHRLGHAARHGDLDPEGGGSGACAGERRGRGDRADAGGPGGDRRAASAAPAQAGAGYSLVANLFRAMHGRGWRPPNSAPLC